jgi:predicted Zn-dependent protease with MMP-like domain
VRNEEGSQVLIPRSEFEDLVVRALDDLPSDFLKTLDNVEVVIEAEPSPHQRRSVGAGRGTLFGLYEGIPRTERTSAYSLVTPDKITIFSGPICRAARTESEVRRLVRRTVVHELAHHFGISDDRLRELGVY